MKESDYTIAYRLAAQFADHCRATGMPAGSMFDGVAFEARFYGDRCWTAGYKCGVAQTPPLNEDR